MENVFEAILKHLGVAPYDNHFFHHDHLGYDMTKTCNMVQLSRSYPDCSSSLLTTLKNLQCDSYLSHLYHLSAQSD